MRGTWITAVLVFSRHLIFSVSLPNMLSTKESENLAACSHCDTRRRKDTIMQKKKLIQSIPNFSEGRDLKK